MNKTILYVVGGVVALGAVAAGAVGLMASQQPDTVTVSRSVVIDASRADVHPMLDDYHAFAAWNPWSKKDPDIVKTISDPPTGVGASYEWSGNDDVGVGAMKTLTVTDDQITQSLHFKEPMESKATVTYDLASEGTSTRVSWTMDMPNNFMLKVMTAVGVVNMDDALGPDFEDGLASLKTMAEDAAKERIAAETKAAEEAAAAEAAAAMAAEGEGEGEAAGGEAPAPE